jgi:hypothetical protein
MKLKNRLVYILAVLIAPLVGTVTQAQTITVLQRFDFQGFGINPTATLPHKISDEGDLVGTVVDVSGKQQGFIYKYRLQKFSAPFSDPNDTGSDTQGRGINILRHCVGEYLNGSDGTFHGYLFRHEQVPPFTEVDVAGAVDTIPLGINNNGDFVGTCVLPNGDQPAFASMSQQVTTFAVPNANATFAYQITDSNQIIGSYTDANDVTHGFTRDSAGNLTFPIDVPGATGTMLFGNNAMNWGVGRYTDASGVSHGLYFITPDNILSFDAPFADSTFTSVDGINIHGQACGYYVDTAGKTHGLVLQVANPTPTPTARPTPTPTPTASPTPTPTAAATPSATATPTATATAAATATATATPTGSPSCTPIVIQGSISLSDPTQTDHLNRSGIPQTCPATTTCAIFGDGLLHHYDAYTFTNTTGASQCVTIDTNSTCTGVRFIFTAAYLGSFDPNNICTNWIGDSGFSPNADQAFAVEIPAGQNLVVVVSNVTATGTCPNYTLTVTGLCGGGTPTPTPTVTPTATATATATPTPTLRPGP